MILKNLVSKKDKFWSLHIKGPYIASKMTEPEEEKSIYHMNDFKKVKSMQHTHIYIAYKYIHIAYILYRNIYFQYICIFMEV